MNELMYPPKVHLDALSIREDGGLLMSASSLNHRLWTGSIWYFDDPSKAPDTQLCQAGLDLEASLASVIDLKWVPSSNKFVASSDSGAVMLWEVEQEDTMTCLAQPIEHDDLVLSLDINADNTKLVSASQDCRVKVWDLEDFISTNTYKGHYLSVWCVACHPTDPSVFASCSQDGKVLIWDTRKARPASVLNTQYIPSMTSCVAWQPSSSQMVALGTETGQLVLHDTKSNNGLCDISPVHCRQITRLAFSPHSVSEGFQLASASEDSTAAISQFSTADGATKLSAVHHQKGHRDFVKGLAWDPKIPTVYTCAWDGQLLSFDSSKQGTNVTGTENNIS